MKSQPCRIVKNAGRWEIEWAHRGMAGMMGPAQHANAGCSKCVTMNKVSVSDLNRSDSMLMNGCLVNGVTRDGGYAEYVTLRTEAVVSVPEDIDPAEFCPLLCAGVTVFNCKCLVSGPYPSPEPQRVH